MKKSLYSISMVVILFAIITACNSSQTQTQTQVAEVYQCPMDCEEGKTYDKEGTCPVCGMDLEKVEKEK